MDQLLEKILPYILNTLPVWYLAIIVVIFYLVRFYYRDFRPLSKGLEEMKSDIQEIKNEVKKTGVEIMRFNYELGQTKSFLISKHKLNIDIFSMKNSPRKLNENGQKLFNDANCQEFLDANKDYLLSEIEKAKPETALDVEQWANIVCYDATAKPIFKKLKDFVYNCPTREVVGPDGELRKYDVTLYDICFVLSFPVRDLYLQAHPEISIEE